MKNLKNKKNKLITLFILIVLIAVLLIIKLHKEKIRNECGKGMITVMAEKYTFEETLFGGKCVHSWGTMPK